MRCKPQRFMRTERCAPRDANAGDFQLGTSITEVAPRTSGCTTQPEQDVDGINFALDTQDFVGSRRGARSHARREI
jgi:hypothetical protein